MEALFGKDIGVVAIVTRSVNLQRQARQEAGFLGAHIAYRHRPVALSLLAPELHARQIPDQMGRHAAVGAAESEGLLGVDGRAVHQGRHGAVGRCQLDDQVAQSRVAQVDAELDMFDLDRAVDVEGPGVSTVAVGDSRPQIERAGRTHHLVDRGVGLGPGAGQLHGGIGVDQAEAELIIEQHAAEVEVGRAIALPGQRIRMACRQRQDLLHIAVAEQRIGFEHQCGNARDDRR